MLRFLCFILFNFYILCTPAFSATIYDSCMQFDRIEDLSKRDLYCSCFQKESVTVDITDETKARLANTFTMNLDEALGIPVGPTTPSQAALSSKEGQELLKVYSTCTSQAVNSDSKPKT